MRRPTFSKRGVAMRELPIHLFGDRPLVQGEHQEVGPLSYQRPLYRHRPRLQTRPFEQNIVFGDRAAGPPHRLHQTEKRALRCDEIGKTGAAQRRCAYSEKLLGRGIDEKYLPTSVESDDRIGQSGNQQRGIETGSGLRQSPHRYAAPRSTSGS